MRTPFFLILASLCLFGTLAFAQDPADFFDYEEEFRLQFILYESNPDILEEEVRKATKAYHQKQTDAYYRAYRQRIDQQNKEQKLGKAALQDQIVTQGFAASSTASEGLVPDAVEYAALVAFYNATGGSNWTHNDNWLQGTTSADFATWYGLEVTNGDVTTIWLSDNNLAGYFPAAIGDLTELRELYFSYDQISSIPSQIIQLTKLTDLQLWDMQLASVPDELADLTSLKLLTLSYNPLTYLPPNFSNLTNLETLTLYYCQLTEIPTLSGMSNMTILNIAGNQLEALPMRFDDLPGIDFLAFSYNEININEVAKYFTGPDTYPSSYSDLFYSPQAEIIGEAQLDTALAGEPITLQAFNDNHPQTRFQWYQLINGDWTELPGQTNETYTIASVSLADAGQYRCRITNDWISNMVQYSAPIILEVIDDTSNEGELSDSLEIEALTTFYNAARGNNWSNNSNWLQGSTIDDVVTWHGITVEGGDVTAIQLNNNNLSGAISLKINDLLGLDELNIQGNEFTVNAIANYFTGPDTYPVANFIYQPQAEIIGENTTENPSVGDPLVLRSFTNNHPQTRFQWYRKEGSTWTEITGQTGEAYTISSVSPAEAGEYRCRINNDWVSGMVQYSAPITVQVEEPVVVDEGQVPDALEYAALAAIYHATQGDEWINNDNWLQGSTSEDFASWWGVKVTDGDIDSLILSGNNLNGSVPTEIGNLTELLNLTLGENRITRLPPAIGRLSNLVELSLSATELTSLPPETGNLINLKDLAIQGNELTTIPGRIVNLPLERLNVSDNQLGTIPNFNDHPTLQQLEIGDNKIIVNDIAFNRDGPGIADHDFATFAYAPQAEIVGTAQSQFAAEGQDVSLRAFTNNHPQTRFQWYRQAGNTWTELTGETQETYPISSVTTANAGQYRCKITNDWVLNITQYSEPITLEITTGPYYSVGDGLWTDAIWALEPGGAPVGTYPQARSEAYIVGHDITVNQPLTTGSVHVIVDRAPSSLTVDGAKMVIYGELDLTKQTEGFPGNVKVVNDGRIVPLQP